VSLQEQRYRLLVHSKRDSTQASYDVGVGMFRKFWQETEQQGEPFPLTDEAVEYFVTWLSQRDLQKSTITQYLSAVRHHNVIAGFGERAKCMELLLRGVANLQAETHGPKKAGVIWEAAWAVEAATALTKQLATPNSDLKDVQALVACVFGFLFAQRASTTVAVGQQDVSHSRGVLQFEERVRKSKGEPVTRTLSVPLGNCRLARAVFAYLGFMRTKHAAISDNFLVSLWLVPDHPSSTMNAILSRVRELLKLPALSQQHSHALRRGAATAMHTLGVQHQRILSWGAWKTHQSLQPYIQNTAWTTRSQAHEDCFGWMLQGGGGCRDKGQQGTGASGKVSQGKAGRSKVGHSVSQRY